MQERSLGSSEGKEKPAGLNVVRALPAEFFVDTESSDDFLETFQLIHKRTFSMPEIFPARKLLMDLRHEKHRWESKIGLRYRPTISLFLSFDTIAFAITQDERDIRSLKAILRVDGALTAR